MYVVYNLYIVCCIASFCRDVKCTDLVTMYIGLVYVIALFSLVFGIVVQAKNSMS